MNNLLWLTPDVRLPPIFFKPTQIYFNSYKKTSVEWCFTLCWTAPECTHSLLWVTVCHCLLSLWKRLMTLKESARAVCDNESLCECVTGSHGEHSGRVKEQPKSHTLFIPRLPVRNEFISPPAVGLSDWYSLFSQFCTETVRETLRGERRFKPLPKKVPLDKCDANVSSASVLYLLKCKTALSAWWLQKKLLNSFFNLYCSTKYS